MEIFRIITDLDRKLENPFDCIHAREHHQDVWKNCQTIILREGLKEIDIPALQIAALGHDVERNSNKHSFLKQTMLDAGADDIFAAKVIGIISRHSFGYQQISLEEKILYDADKLDYLSISRLQTLLEARNKGEMTEERFSYYKQTWLSRIMSVKDTLHFSYTKKRFKTDLKKLIKFMEQTPQVEDMAEFIML